MHVGLADVMSKRGVPWVGLARLAQHPRPPLPRAPQGWIDKSILDRTRALLQRAHLPIMPPPQMTVELFKSLMAVDKKVGHGLGASAAKLVAPGAAATSPAALQGLCSSKGAIT